MKFNVQVEATPIEARQFLGLPDVTPLHDIWLTKMRELLTTGINPADADSLIRTWMSGVPSLNENFEKWQQLFWASAGLGSKPEGRP